MLCCFRMHAVLFSDACCAVFGWMHHEKHYNRNGNHVPIERTKAVPNWWSSTKTGGEIQVPRISFTNDGKKIVVPICRPVKIPQKK